MPFISSYDGTRISYRITGSGPLLVCVAGGPRAPGYLEDLGGLSAHRTLLYYDHRGTGDSATPADPATYAYPALADDLEALRAQLGLADVDLLAHSNGTVVAQAFAARHPDRVRRMVLIGPGTELYPEGGHDLGEILASHGDEPWYPDVSQAAFELLKLPPDADPERVVDVLDRYAPAAYARWTERQQRHAEVQRKLLSIPAWTGFAKTDADPADVVAALARVTAPVLVVTGDRDGLTGVAVGDLVAAAFPDSRHETLVDSGHYPWVDVPELFCTTVERFLSGGAS
ncbi:alpha/beta hydrolase [Actinosynnema sp. NPDC023658]|uniref:alpha/beta fold hydrolase n=1 Tax=Actinosynnema sp. NPDC023658 TaxID=3155465 RepID=UPI0033F60601